MTLEGWAILGSFFIGVGGIMIAMIKLMIEVRHELRPNHGQSARDAITRTENNTDTINSDLVLIKRALVGIRTDIARLSEVDDEDRGRAVKEHETIYNHISNEINKLKGKKL